MKNRFAFLFILFFAIFSFSVNAQEANPCDSPWWNLWDQAQCYLGGWINDKMQEFGSWVSDLVAGTVNYDGDAKGSPAFYDFSLTISISLATLFLIATVVLYFAEAFKETASYDVLERLRSQMFRFFIMIVVLFTIDQFISLFITSINDLNRSITQNMISNGDLAAALIGWMATAAATLLIFYLATMGVAFIATVILFLSFFIVALIKGVILYVLLSIVPVIIVLYFFDFTERIGRRLLALLIGHVLISTVWITIFALAFNYSETYPIGPSKVLVAAFAPIAAIVINSILYFKMMSFFGTYSDVVLARGKTFAPVVNRTIIRYRTWKRSRPQTKLTSFTD